MKNKITIISLFLSFLLTLSVANKETQENEEITESTKILSRKKRFLVFPDGSSFQLVFCAQNHGYLQIGDIVWFGNTAALAWELPTDPSLFNVLKKSSKLYEEPQRRLDSKLKVYINENGKVLSAVPYHKKFIVNPAFAKRSIEDAEIKPTSVEELHERNRNRSYLYDLDETSIEFHRLGRKSLYEKLETFFKGLGYSGKECVLRMLCESSELKQEQGTFLEEIMRATFTFPQNKLKPEINEKYDIAHKSAGNCAKLYPECENVQGRNTL